MQFIKFSSLSQDICIILIIMLNDSQYSQELQNLTLTQILEGEDLVMEEILAIKDIHNDIKRNLKVFTDYCRKNPSFTQKFIAIGLKCPMHQSNNTNMKNMTYIAADVLSCDHQSLSDLFILPSKKSSKEEDELMVGGEQIQQEIQTDIGQANNEQGINKYKFLQNVLDYINSEELDQNCLNYITKALNILIRRKLSQLLQFFYENNPILKRLVDLSHYPSIAHFLAKLLTDDQDNLSAAALQVKKNMIPLILDKIHNSIFKPKTVQVLQCIEDILNSSRYGDLQQRSELQKISDIIVSAKEYAFHVQNIIQGLSTNQDKYEQFIGVLNSSSFLSVVINRMNMDQQQDSNFSQSQQLKLTLVYEIEGLYSNFCKLIALFSKIWKFKSKFDSEFWFMANKVIQPLILMSKHSRFGQFYRKRSKQQRLQALQTLIFVTCQIQIHGILLQSATTLLQKMLIQEEKLAQTQIQIVFPGDLYKLISERASSLGILVSSLLEETTNQRNKNENGIYFRKILVLFDNYFKHTAVLQRYPDTSSLSNIFPLFNQQNCKIFAEKAAILNHPDGKKVRQVSQFQFLQKNNTIRRSNSPSLDQQQSKTIVPIQEAKIQPQKKPVQIIFKLEGKLKAHKERVKQKQVDKDQIAQPKPNTSENANPNQVQKETQSPNKQKDRVNKQEQKIKNQICKPKQPQPGLNFFVRHLMIY